MEELFRQNGVDFPADILGRLHLISRSDYEDLFQREFGEDAFPLGPGYCASAVRAAFICPAMIKSDDELRACGLHELAHTPTYTEYWVSPAGAEMNKRRGLVKFDPKDFPGNPERSGATVLDEGFVDLIKRESMRRVGLPVPANLYQPNLELVDILVDLIGARPLFQATYTEPGLAELDEILKTRYGGEGLKTITSLLGAEQHQLISNIVNRVDQRDPRRVNPYEHTKAALLKRYV